MMKYILVFALSLPVLASDLHVECKSIDEAFRNQFTIEFVIPSGESRVENFDLEFYIKKNGRNTQIETMTLVRDLTIEKFEPGDLTVKPFFLIKSLDINTDPVFINLAVDYPQPLSSFMRLKDDMTYFSTCKSI